MKGAPARSLERLRAGWRRLAGFACAGPWQRRSLTPGVAERAARAAQFTGELADLSVADLIQILQLMGKGAVITVSQDRWQSHLWCSAGEIVDAQSGVLRGEAAVYRILGFESGSIVADLRSTERARTVFGSAQRLLLEAARRKDEAVVLRQRLGDEQRFYRLDVEPADAPELSAGELAVLRSFVEARSLRDVVDSSELGDFETWQALVRWIELGYLVDAGVRSLPAAEGPANMAHSAAPSLESPLPLAASPRSERAASLRWVRGNQVFGMLAALALIFAGYMLGARTAHVVEPGTMTSLPVAVTSVLPSDPASSVNEISARPPDSDYHRSGRSQK